jgi:hypothetical protein
MGLAPFVLVLSDGVFGRFDLAALRGCRTFVCWFDSMQYVLAYICMFYWSALPMSRSVSRLEHNDEVGAW